MRVIGIVYCTSPKSRLKQTSAEAKSVEEHKGAVAVLFNHLLPAQAQEGESSEEASVSDAEGQVPCSWPLLLPHNCTGAWDWAECLPGRQEWDGIAAGGGQRRGEDGATSCELRACGRAGGAGESSAPSPPPPLSAPSSPVAARSLLASPRPPSLYLG
ncbi:Os02g0218250 [Oryza sativa Japonica Group]|uniref:Os02g0218250 protein n=1 Tax=Oryza sativa subsp. japonica TaxID=39947 RepID=A0A0N7KEY0_ORYSJ|nr:Os02g0218250 [Oryza sativa Japonica Group]